MVSFDVNSVVRGEGSVLRKKVYMNLAICSLYRSSSFTIFNCLNKGLVCALYCAPVMILIAFFLLNEDFVYIFYVFNMILQF